MLSLITRLFSVLVGRPNTKARPKFRPKYEPLEARDVPAIFIWMGGNSGDPTWAGEPANWFTNAQDHDLPAAYDDLIWLARPTPVTSDPDAPPPTPPPPVNCDDFQGGPYNSMVIPDFY